MRFVFITLLLVTLAVGCRCEPLLKPTTGGLEVTPGELQFPPLYVGARATAVVTLTNTGPAGLDISLSTQAPFSSPPELRLGGGESATVEVEFTASVAGEAEGRLVVTADAKETEVSLRASALPPFSCPSAECRSSVFDPQAGACVTTALVDGAACNPGCGASGLCVAGTCRAQSAGLCDDADPCTVDACGADGRCVALPRECPVSNRCQLASCRPGVGCVEEPVEDGVACGDRLCASALICLGGSCVRAATPDGDRQCTYVDVSVHNDSSCAKNAAGAVRCWGENARDELLRGAPSVSEAPGVWPIGVPVDSFTGQNILCAISSGRVSCPDNRPVQVDAGDDLWAQYIPQGGCGTGGGASGVLADGGLRACLSHPALVGAAVTGLRTSRFHGCALAADGGVLCFGSANSFLDGGGVAATAAHLETPPVTEVVPTFDRNTCVLGLAGDVTCWGLRPAEIPRPLGPWKHIAPRGYGGLIYGHRTDGLVETCARHVNDAGVLEEWQACTLIPDAGPYTKISVGRAHGCGLTDGGQVECWGINDEGQLGADTLPVSAVRRADVDVAWLEGYDPLTTVFKDGGVVITGTEFFRGPPTRVQLAEAFKVDDLCANLALSGGALFSFDRNTGTSQRVMAVPVDATLEQPFQGSCCLFSASQGLLSCSLTPSVAPEAELREWQLGPLGRFECGLLVDGRVVCAGQPSENQLGLGDAGITSGPLNLPPAKSLALLSSGGCVLTVGGEVWCWGDRMGRPVPAPISGLNRPARQLECSSDHCCALAGSNSIQCWGNNFARQLGSAGPSTLAPRRVVVAGPVVRLSRLGLCAVLTGGEVECWGHVARTGLLQSEAPIRVIH